MSDLVKVSNYFDRISAEMAKGVLDAEGIKSYVSADDAGGIRPSPPYQEPAAACLAWDRTAAFLKRSLAL